MVRRSTNGRLKSITESSPKINGSKDTSLTAGGGGRRSTRLETSTAAVSHTNKQKLMEFELTDSENEEDFNVTKAIPKRGAAKSNSKKPSSTSRRSSGNKNSSKEEDDDDEEEDDDMDVDEDEDEDDADDENSPPKKKKRGVKGKKEDAKKKASSAKKSKSFDEEDEDFDEDEEEYPDEESEPSDGEDENEDVDASAHVNFKDEEWFDKVTKICQVCKTNYKTCRDASLCVTGQHRRLRCYLCYNYYRNTDTLFRHYESNHRASNCKKEQLLCPFCSQSTPFKSTSCHVITTHIAPREAAQNASTSSVWNDDIISGGIKRKEGKAGRGKKRNKGNDSDDSDEEEEDEEEKDEDDDDEEEDDDDDDEEEDDEDDE